MSYTRFGSICQHTWEPMPEDEACPVDKCPGSDVHFFKSTTGIECCGCMLKKGALTSFTAPTKVAFAAHVEEHVQAGHHIRPSVVAHFRRVAMEARASMGSVE